MIPSIFRRRFRLIQEDPGSPLTDNLMAQRNPGPNKVTGAVLRPAPGARRYCATGRTRRDTRRIGGFGSQAKLS